MIKDWFKYRVSKNDIDTVIDWLIENVGRVATVKQDIGADWILYHASGTDFRESEYVVGIRDSNKAMMFKLRWCGL